MRNEEKSCELCHNFIIDPQHYYVISEYEGKMRKPADYKWRLCKNCYNNRWRYDMGYTQDLLDEFTYVN